MEAAADLGRIDEVQLEPKRRTASANLGEIRALTAISDQRRVFKAKFLQGFQPDPTSTHPENLDEHIACGS